MPNDLSFVRSTMTLLERHGIQTWLFGGWAEELRGMARPRRHRDIDLLHRSSDFEIVDHFLGSGLVDEIPAKRLPHKRAFVVDGVMVEILLVGPDLTTTFWGRRCWSGRPTHSLHHQ
jgi:hypothetical protein